MCYMRLPPTFLPPQHATIAKPLQGKELQIALVTLDCGP